MRYVLWRQDDNGNQVAVARFDDRAVAERARADFEARAHEQIYWVAEADADARSPVAATHPPGDAQPA